jgi:broad specificity phosphatase PhoE
MQTNNIPTKLFLFRHTQTINTLNGDFRYNGFIDVDVDEKGLDVLKRFIPFIKKQNIKAIYSSDLTRAIKGAEIFSKALNIKVIFSEKLREVKQGRWEGLSYNEIMERFPEEAEKKFQDYVNFKVKDAENLIEASNRVNSFIDSLLKKHRGESVLTVAHGGINTLILLKALNMELHDFFRIKQDFGCLNEIDYFENFAKVVRINSVPALF